MTEPIYFDARYIRVDHHDGISRFSVGLIDALARLTKVVAIISDDRQLEYLPAGIAHHKIHGPTSWQEPFTSLKLNRLGAKIVYSPMQTMGSLGRRFRLVLTLHDLIYYRHPAPPPSMPAAVRLMWRLYHLSYWPQRWALNGADGIATVSQTTRNLMAQHRLTKRPVKVVYNAAGAAADTFGATGRERPTSNSLVYMGSFMGYKNVETLIDAMAHLPNHTLHLLSKITPARKAQLQQHIAANSGDVVFHGGVSEDEYQQLLREAVALVSASLDEGFGIPLVEAMSQGTPVVVSDIEIFREIAGEIGNYFNPSDPADLARAISSLDDGQLWSQESANALVRVQDFGWDKSAQSLLELIRSL
jgi:glycosyltransferase involved in cell wall biosynthesis